MNNQKVKAQKYTLILTNEVLTEDGTWVGMKVPRKSSLMKADLLDMEEIEFEALVENLRETLGFSK